MMVRRLALFSACAFMIAATPALPRDPLAAIGVSMNVPAGWTVSTVESSGEAHNPLYLSLQKSNLRNDSQYVEMVSESRDGQDPLKVATRAINGLVDVGATPWHAQAACHGTQDGWVVDISEQGLNTHVAVVASSTRVAVARYGYASLDRAMFDSIDALCVETPSAESASIKDPIEQLLNGMNVDAQIPPGWTLASATAPAARAMRTTALFAQFPRKLGAIGISVSSEPLRSRTLEQFVQDSALPGSVTESHKAPLCSGTQTGWWETVEIHGMTVRTVYAVANDRGATMTYARADGAPDDAAAIAALSTLCAK